MTLAALRAVTKNIRDFHPHQSVLEHLEDFGEGFVLSLCQG